jgi:hypothetical protein
MKKLVLITVAVLVLGSCASTGSGGGGSDQDEWWFLAREEGGMKVRNNQINLKKGENYVYIYFKNTKPKGDFDKVQVDFTLSQALPVVWQCAYQPGAVWGSTEYIGSMDKGPIETDLVSFTQNWYNGGVGDSITKSRISGLCLMIEDSNGGTTFTLTGVSFQGLRAAEEEED